MDAGLAAIAGTLAGVAFTQAMQTLNERQRQVREDRRHWIDVRREAYMQFMEAAHQIAAAGGFVLDAVRMVDAVADDLEFVIKAAAPTYGVAQTELQTPLGPGMLTKSFEKDLDHAYNQIQLIGSPEVRRKAREVWWFVFANVRMRLVWAAIAIVAGHDEDETLGNAMKHVDQADMLESVNGLTRRISEFEAAARRDLGVQNRVGLAQVLRGMIRADRRGGRAAEEQQTGAVTIVPD